MNSTMLPAGVEDGPALLTDAANPSSLTAELPTTTRTDEPTLASTWLGVAGTAITDELLEWPADLFALSDVLLERAESYRLVFSAPDGGRWPPSRFSPSEETTWPPGRFANWSNAVEAAAREWCVWAEDHTSPFPALLAEAWSTVLERASMPLEQLAQGRDWRICEALLIVHTIADEACAGLFAALDRSDGRGFLYRARGRELLARTGSLARIPSHLLRVLPKVSTPRDGGANFSRYACVQQPGIDTRWHKLPARHPGTDSRAEHVNVLMLPWPLRVRESDFRPVNGSVSRLSKEPFGLFEFAPSETLDLDLVDRTLVAARDEVRNVDVVVLPESAVEAGEIDELETLLDRHGVMYLQTGVRERSKQPGRLGANYVHVGVNPRLHRGRALENEPGGGWLHVRQNKHHRWSLDERQIYQYNLAGALHPKIRWWEAMDVPRRSLQLLQVGEITIASLVCEDLAQNDGVAEIIRSVGPSIVVAVLLDGPQLTSRWAARYASVLADDPGSAVLTLTSYGMVQRSRPPGHDPSSVVALWKDPERGTREISLEPGAQGSHSHPVRRSRHPPQRRRPLARRHRDSILRRRRTPDPSLRHRLGVNDWPSRSQIPARAGNRRTHDPHRLGRGSRGSPGIHPRSCPQRPRRRTRKRTMAGLARHPRTIPARHRGDRFAHPRGHRGHPPRPCAHIRRSTRRNQRRQPRRKRPQPADAQGAAINTRTTPHTTSKGRRPLGASHGACRARLCSEYGLVRCR